MTVTVVTQALRDAPALATDPAVPLWARMSVPTALAATAGVFLWSNLVVGASVVVRVAVAGQTFDLPPVFDFTLRNSVRDMWQGEVGHPPCRCISPRFPPG
jgi:hypothetical protein